MNWYINILTAFILLPSTSSRKHKHIHVDVIDLAGNQKEGRTPEVVFINYFTFLPLEPYPVKTDGPTIEIPPDERYLLPDYVTYMVNLILVILSVFIMFHLLRRRPIDHSVRPEKRKPSHQEKFLGEMLRDRKSDASRLFFYQKWTNHVTTGEKLAATFGRDFELEYQGLTDEEYAQKIGAKVEHLKLKKSLVDDDDQL